MLRTIGAHVKTAVLVMIAVPFVVLARLSWLLADAIALIPAIGWIIAIPFDLFGLAVLFPVAQLDLPVVSFVSTPDRDPPE